MKTGATCRQERPGEYLIQVNAGEAPDEQARAFLLACLQAWNNSIRDHTEEEWRAQLYRLACLPIRDKETDIAIVSGSFADAGENGYITVRIGNLQKRRKIHREGKEGELYILHKRHKYYESDF